MEVIGHFEMPGDQMRLIDAARSRPADIELLQGDDVRRVSGDDAGDPLGRRSAVHADAAMHVVGHDPQPAM